MFHDVCPCFSSSVRHKDEIVSDVLHWTPAYGQSKAGRPARTYIQQLCDDTGCNPEDLLEALNDRETWRERVSDIRVGRTTWWWWFHDVNKIFFYLLISEKKNRFPIEENLIEPSSLDKDKNCYIPQRDDFYYRERICLTVNFFGERIKTMVPKTDTASPINSLQPGTHFF